MIRVRAVSRAAGVPGLEPRLTGPEPVGLPITPYPNGIGPVSRSRPRSLADSGRAGQPEGHGARSPGPVTGAGVTRAGHWGPISARPAMKYVTKATQIRKRNFLT